MDEHNGNKNSHRNWKVKVYLLNEMGNWDDCGTGILELIKENSLGEEIDFFHVQRIEDAIEDSTSPTPEDRLQKLKGNTDNPKIILHSPISADSQFEKQGDSIISWVDKELEEEIAISFLDITVANETWKRICKVLGNDPSEEKRNHFGGFDDLIIPTEENLEKIKSDNSLKKEKTG